MTEKEFRSYFHEMYPQLARYAMRLIGDNDVDDILQDAFIELWNRHHDFADTSHINAFVYRSIYTHALNVIKHRNVVRKYSDAVIEMENRRLAHLNPEHNDILSEMTNNELRNKIESVIEELPNKSRQAFVMSYLHGMKNKEIAHVMNVSVRTVDAHIYNALKFVRSRLENNARQEHIFILFCVSLLSYFSS